MFSHILNVILIIAVISLIIMYISKKSTQLECESNFPLSTLNPQNCLREFPELVELNPQNFKNIVQYSIDEKKKLLKDICLPSSNIKKLKIIA